MIHDTSGFNIDNPQAGTFVTIILAFVTIATTSLSFLQGIDLILGILAKLGACGAAFATITAAYYTVQASRKKLKE